MKTAVVVTGALRYTQQASTSWKFDGDYFLVVDRDHYLPQDHLPIGSIDPGALATKFCDIDFRAIVIADNVVDDTTALNTAIKMAWKWKLAYHTVYSYHASAPYDRIILLRPDLYIGNYLSDISLVTPQENAIYTTRPSYIQPSGLPWASDILLMMSPAVFEILSGFYDFLMFKYHQLANSDIQRGDIHSFLFEYALTKDIVFLGELAEFCPVVLRENSLDMFDNTGLKPEFDVSDLEAASSKWWENKWKL